MTVAELITALAAYAPEMLVVTPGFDEADFDDVAIRGVVRLRLNAHARGHCGAHEEVGSDTPSDGEALVISFL